MVPSINNLQATLDKQKKIIARADQAYKLLRTHAWKVVIEQGFFKDHLDKCIADLPSLTGEAKENAISVIIGIGVLKNYLAELPQKGDTANTTMLSCSSEIDRLRGNK